MPKKQNPAGGNRQGSGSRVESSGDIISSGLFTSQADKCFAPRPGPIVGIDPGNFGALALLEVDGTLSAIIDMPCLEDGTKGRRTINAPILAAILREHAPRHAYIELIGARPTDAKTAAFSFGRCRGALEGVCGALAIPVTMIAVPSWRRAVGLPAGATKDVSRGEAVRRWPAHAASFARVKDDGRAEACLIGIAGIIKFGGQL